MGSDTKIETESTCGVCGLQVTTNDHGPPRRWTEVRLYYPYTSVQGRTANQECEHLLFKDIVCPDCLGEMTHNSVCGTHPFNEPLLKRILKKLAPSRFKK